MLSNLAGYSPEGAFKNASFHAFYLYSKNCHGTSLDVSTSCETYSNNVFSDIPYLDVTAVLNDEAKTLVLNVVNRHETDEITGNIVLQTGEFTGSATASVVNGKISASDNPRAEEPVTVTSADIKFKGNEIRYTFPAHSLTQLLVPLK